MAEQQSTAQSIEGRGPADVQVRAASQRWWVLVVLSLVVTVVEIDATIVNVALPSLSRALGASTSDLAWVNDAYILCFAAFVLIGGRLGDQFGHKRMLQLSMLLVGISSLLCAVSTSTIELIVFRALLGIGSAGVLPATLALVTITFPNEERPKAFGVWSAMTVIGLPLGPLLGGWLLTRFWWGSVFLINVPLVLISLVSVQLIVRAVTPAEGRSSAKQDVPGVVLSAVGIAAVLFAVIEAPRFGWASAQVIAAAVVGVVLIGAFLLWERRAAAPVLDLRLLRLRSFVMGSLATVLSYFAFTGILFILTQYMQGVLALTPLQAGAGLIPMMVFFTVGALAAAKGAMLIGTRTVVSAGLLVIGAGMLVLYWTNQERGYTVVGISLGIIGLGTGMTVGQALAASLAEVPPTLAGIASAVGNSVRQFGGAIGVAVLGAVLVSEYSQGLSPWLQGVSGSLASQAKESLAGAGSAASAVGGGSGARLLSHANDAFVTGMHTAVIIGTVLTVLSAIGVFFSLPGGNLAKQGEGEAAGELA